MATATVTISNVRLEGMNTLVPGSVAGADPWNDADAGTYSESTASYRTNPFSADEFEEAVADLTLPGLDVATLNSVTLNADLTSINVGDAGTGQGVLISLHDPVLGEVTAFTGPTDTLTGGVMDTITTSATTAGSDPAVLTDFVLPCLIGGTIHIIRAGNADAGVPGDITIRVHRLVLTIDYEPGAAPVVVEERATRLFPRDDALGLGAAPRLVPAPRGGRLVGGYM